MTLGNLLQARSLEAPGKAAVVADGRATSYAALNESSSRLARWFVRQGLEPGDRVAIHWSNTVEAAQLYFAIFKAGLIAVPLNPRAKGEEIANILEHSEAVLCFSEPSLAVVSLPAAEGCRTLRRILTEIPTEELTGPLPEVRYGQPAALFYAPAPVRPKGAIHTHRTLLEAARVMSQQHLTPQDVVLAATSLMDVYGLCAALLPAVHAGATTVLSSLPDPAALLDAVERDRCTCMTVPPPLLRLMVEEQDRKARRMESLRTVIAGGDSVRPKMRSGFEAEFGMTLHEGCAMTQTCPIVIDPARALRASSRGPSPAIEIRILDRASRDVKEGETGEIVVHSPANCVGHWNDDAATRDLFDHGWLRTRDLGHRTANGCYWFRCHAPRTSRNVAARYVPAGHSADVPSEYYSAV